MNDMPSTANESASTTQSSPKDYTWSVTAANWFLLFFVALLFSRWGTGPEMFGVMTAVILVAAVPTCVIYLAVTNKKAFRWKRAMTISGWVMVLFLAFPAISDWLR